MDGYEAAVQNKENGTRCRFRQKENSEFNLRAVEIEVAGTSKGRTEVCDR